MSITQEEISVFFSRYESRFNDALAGGVPDIDATVNSFAEHFIEANPFGVTAGDNNQKFKDAIGQGWSFYKTIGIQSMKIVSNQITILDEFHAIAKVNWKCSFVRPDKSKGAVAFDLFYLVQKRENKIKIFAYIAGDEQQVLKNEGLIP
jgi:hypothetical protein